METTDQPVSDEPKFFGDYEVLKWIGRGKFAVVYRARKVGTDTMVALKRVSVDLMDEKTREKCLKEVRLLQNLDHKNIIRYMDSFILENDLIIVFEWAAAGDLKRQLRKAIERGSGFDERTIWKYFSQICDAMQHMHERRIMHRDLKPANIFLTLDGTIKVGDLGLSREMSEHTIQAHSKVGTPLYMSPEVLNGEGYDFKTDIWSLGCLLYELASLKSPFKQEGMNLYALCQKIASGDFQPLSDSFSEDLRSLVYSMISTKPADRPEIGSVCAVARRMRAETQDKRNKKASASSAPPAAAASEAKTESSRIKPDEQQSDKQQPSTEFDIKPPTAVGDKQQQPQTPAQWNLNIEPENVAPKDQRAIESKQQDEAEARSSSKQSRRNTHSRESKSEAAAGVADTFVSLNFRTASPAVELDSAPAPARVIRGPSAESTGDRPGSSKPLSAPGGRPASTNSKKTNVQAARNPNRFREGFFADAAPAFAVMETLHSKLVLLNYSPHEDGFDDLDDEKEEQQEEAASRAGRRTPSSSSMCAFLPFHFACDLQSFDIAGRAAGSQFFQFRRMVCVAVWLAKKMRRSSVDDVIKSIDTSVDTPLATAKQVLRLAQLSLGLFPALDSALSSSELQAISATSLTPGYGYNVCCVLTVLADCALQSESFSVKPCVYDTEARDVEEKRGGSVRDTTEVVEEEDFDPEEVNDRGTSSRGGSSGVSNNNKRGSERDEEEEEDVEDDNHDLQSISDVYQHSFLSHGAAEGAAAVGSMLFGAPIDPVLWKEETERVARVLAVRMAAASSSVLASTEWTGRIQLMKGYSDLTASAAATDKKDDRSRSSSSVSVPDLVSAVAGLRGSLSGVLQSLRSAEKSLTNQHSEAALKFSSLMTEHSELESRLSAVRSRIGSTSETLSAVEESLEAVSADLRSRIDGNDGTSAGGSGSSRIVALNEALATMRREIKTFQLSSSVLSARLTALRCQEQAAALDKMRTSRASRRKGPH